MMAKALRIDCGRIIQTPFWTVKNDEWQVRLPYHAWVLG
jgi:hypothetical protein